MARVRLNLNEPIHFPPLCVCCGRPASATRQQEFEVAEASAAAALLATGMLGAPVWTRRGLSLSLPVCEWHRRKGRESNRTFFRGMLVTATAILATWLASKAGWEHEQYVGVVAMAALIGTFLVAMQQKDDGLAVRSLKRGSFALVGVHRDLARAMG